MSQPVRVAVIDDDGAVLKSMDQHMPCLTGLELAKRMRARGDLRPIMLMSISFFAWGK